MSLSSPEGREKPYLVPVGKDRFQAVALADVAAVDEDPHPNTAILAEDAGPQSRFARDAVGQGIGDRPALAFHA